MHEVKLGHRFLEGLCEAAKFCGDAYPAVCLQGKQGVLHISASDGETLVGVSMGGRRGSNFMTTTFFLLPEDVETLRETFGDGKGLKMALTQDSPSVRFTQGKRRCTLMKAAGGQLPPRPRHYVDAMWTDVDRKALIQALETAQKFAKIGERTTLECRRRTVVIKTASAVSEPLVTAIPLRTLPSIRHKPVHVNVDKLLDAVAFMRGPVVEVMAHDDKTPLLLCEPRTHARIISFSPEALTSESVPV